MNKPLKITLAVTGVVVVLLVAAVVTVVNIDPNNHKRWIADQFRDYTGRDLSIGGEIGFTLYPWLGVSLSQVVIGNADGFGEEPMFLADEAEIRVKLLPLLSQHYEINTVKLYGARVNLAVNAAGVSNWADLLGDQASPEDSEGDTAEAAGFPLGNIILGGVDVVNASVQLDDRATNVRYDISELSFKTDALVYGQPIDLNITLQAAATRPDLSARVALTGTLFYDLDTGRYEIAPLTLTSTLTGVNLPDGTADIAMHAALKMDLNADTLTVSDLNLVALGSELQATIQGQRVTTAPVFQTDLRISGNDLAQLFRVAEIEPLATQLAGLNNRAFELTTELAVDTGRGTARIPMLRASLLGTSIDGAFQATDIQTPTPAVSGRLQASGPDLPTVVEVLGQIAGGRNSPLSQAGRDLSQVSSKSFAIDAQFDANLRTGNVTVPTLDVRVLGATVTGDLVANNIQSDSPVIRGKLVAAGPDLPLLMQIAGRFQGVDSPLFTTANKLKDLSGKAFSVNAVFDADMQRGNINVPTFSASSLGFEISGNVTTRDLSARNGNVDGALTLTGQNLRGLLRALEQPELGDVLQNVSLQVGVSGSRTALIASPVALNLVFSGDRIPNSPATVTLNADSKLNLDQESLQVERFTLAGLGLNASGKINADKLLDAPTFTGEVSVASFNLRRLLQQLNQAVPEMADNRTLETVSLGTAFSGNSNRIGLSDLNLNLDQTTVRGSLSVENFAKPAVVFDINVTELNADRYLAPPSTAPATASAPVTASDIPVEMIRDLNVKGQLTVEALTFTGLQLADLSLGINAAAGDVQVSPLRANLYQGRFAGSMGLDVTGPVAIARVAANLEAVALEPLMLDFMDASYLSGRGNVQFDVTSRGNDTSLLKTSLTGTGRIALEDGVLKGVDVAGVLGQVETILRSRRVAEIQRGQQTAFETFSATLAITNGVVASNDLLIKSPGIQISGRGTLVDLNTDAIGYNMLTSVDKSTANRNDVQYDIGGYSVPIACTGSISSPRCLPDAGEIVRTALVSETERRVGDLIQRTLGTEPQQPAATAADGTPLPVDPSAPPVPPANATDQLINRALNRILR